MKPSKIRFHISYLLYVKSTSISLLLEIGQSPNVLLLLLIFFLKTGPIIVIKKNDDDDNSNKTLKKSLGIVNEGHLKCNNKKYIY